MFKLWVWSYGIIIMYITVVIATFYIPIVFQSYCGNVKKLSLIPYAGGILSFYEVNRITYVDPYY